MKYYIYVDGKLIETTEKEYNAWFSLEKENLNLREYGITMDGDQHYIAACYHGAWVENDGPPRVFNLIYQQAICRSRPDDEKQFNFYYTQEFFETYEEMGDRMADIIIAIESQVDPFAEGILKEDWSETDLDEESRKHLRDLARELFNNKFMMVRHEDPEFVRLCLEVVFELYTTYKPSSPEERVAMIMDEGIAEYVFCVEGYEVVKIGEEK